MKTEFRLIRIIVIALNCLIFAAALPAPSIPHLDGGGFPTSTPTNTPVPTATHTQQPTATPTNTPQSPDSPDSVNRPGLAEDAILPTWTPIPTPVPEEPARNPLLPVAYIGLFIFLVVGVWILFSQRGRGP